MANIARDAGFPVSAHPTFATTFSTANSASITTPGSNRLLVVVAQWALNAGTTVHVEPLSCSGAGLTWKKMVEVSSFTSGAFPTGSLAIFYAYAQSVLTAQTITVTRNSTAAVAQSAVVTVYSLTGASPNQTGATAGHAASGSSNRSDSISPAAGNWVIGGVGDTGAAGGTSLTAASGCSKDIETLDAVNGDSYDTVSYQGAPGGAITVGFTGTDDSLYVALVEIQAGEAIGAVQNRGPSRNPRDRPHGPQSRFRHSTWASTEVPSVATGTVVGASPGDATFSAPSGQATGKATVGASAGVASFSTASGKATGAARVGGSAASASFTAPSGQAVGKATVGAAPGSGTFTASGKATGAAVVGAAAGAAVFTVPAGKATTGGTPATVGAAPGISTFSVPSGQATGKALVGAAPGSASFTAPSGQAQGAATVGTAAGSATFAQPSGKATGAAAVGASPKTAAFSSPPGKATNGAVTTSTGLTVFVIDD